MAEERVENGENSEKPVKRKFEPSILDNFAKLSKGQEKLVVKSGLELLKQLTENSVEKGENEIKYALARLIRGLGSSSVQTRTGYFGTLVGLLTVSQVSVEEVFEHVAKELHKGGANSKSENADVSLGQILVGGAVIRSDLYVRSSEEDKKKVLEMIVRASKERTYLGLAAFSFITDLYKRIDSKEFESTVFPLIKDEAFKPFPEQNLDTLYLLFTTLEHFPDSIKPKFLKNTFGSTEIISQQNLNELADILTTLPRVAALKHPIYEIFLKKITPSPLLPQFFQELDRTISRNNRNRFLAVVKVTTIVLESVEASTIPDLLTNNFIQQMLHSFKTNVGKNKDREFQESAKKLFETLLGRLKNDVKDKVKIKILKKLLFYPGTFIFEKITKSKLVQNITSTLTAEGIKKLADIYRDVIVAKTDRVVKENLTEKWWNNDRVYASHLLVKLLNHSSVQDNDWKVDQMIFLMRLGLFQNDIGNELADSFKETFYSSLDLKLAKLEDLRYILSKIVGELNGSFGKLRQEIGEDNEETWKETVELITKLEKKKKRAVFHVLFLHLSLQLFNNSKLASDSLKELFKCYDRVKSKQVESSEDPLWIEVVVDLFLNLLSHNSHLLRSIISCVFPHLCQYMTGSAIHQILSVLDPKNDSNPLSKYEESSDEEVEDEESSSESEEEQEEEDEEETTNDRLRMALHQVLGGESDESVDLDDLDEEDGEKLDEALGQAFKQFKPNLGRQKKQNKDDQQLTHFRVRALDLIEIYLNSNPSMLLSLEIMLPLLQALEFSIRDDHQRPLQDRVRACLKKLTNLKKFDDVEGVREQVLVELLQSLLDKGTKNALIVQDMGEKIAECSVFVITCSQLIQSKKRKVVKVIKESLETFFNKRDCLIPYVLFKNVLQLNWGGIVELVPLISSFVFTETIRPFRRSQAVELLKVFYTNRRFLDSQDSVQVLQENFLSDCLEFFRDFCDNPEKKKVREKFIANLFGLLTAIKNSKVADSFEGWTQIGDVVKLCRSNLVLSNDAKASFRKLCGSLKISHIVEMKKSIKLGDEENESVKKEKVKKKRKMNKETKKLKKESKELRLQSLSEGLGGKRKIASLEEENDESHKRVKT